MGYYKAFDQITDLIDIAARSHPDKDAFRYMGSSLTYGGLVSKSRRLTTTLVEAGVRKGDRVGIFLNQSLETPVAIYGILGAGACFVPIDPFAPVNRICQILEKCDVKVLVTNDGKKSEVAEILSASEIVDHVVGLEDSTDSQAVMTSWAEVETKPETPPMRMIELDLAYLMFTSGSTGTPKGMMHTHANGLIYASNLADEHELVASDRFLNLAPLHFDMAVMDYIAAPMVGGTTIIVSEAHARLPASLTKLAAEERASVWYSVPFAMTQMLQFGGMEKYDLTALRWMIYGGEAIPIRHLRGLMSALPNARFCNAYGPAETHQVSSYNIDELPESEADSVPIGKPWKTVDPLIVDNNNNPVPFGEPGELLVRAPSCMRGYWGDEEKTKAAFFHKPVVGEVVDTYYRTGDVVTMQTDGMMYFHGRMDRQIKVRGYRVELDEIEATLSNLEIVRECAVVKSNDGKSVVAFVSTMDGDREQSTPILQHCEKNLPQYAVPTQLNIVNDFPKDFFWKNRP